MRLLRLDVRHIIVAILTLVSILLLLCTVYDPRLLAVRKYLTPYSSGGAAQVRLQASTLIFALLMCASPAASAMSEAAAPLHAGSHCQPYYSSISAAVGCEGLDMQGCGVVDEQSGVGTMSCSPASHPTSSQQTRCLCFQLCQTDSGNSRF